MSLTLARPRVAVPVSVSVSVLGIRHIVRRAHARLRIHHIWLPNCSPNRRSCRGVPGKSCHRQATRLGHSRSGFSSRGPISQGGQEDGRSARFLLFEPRCTARKLRSRREHDARLEPPKSRLAHLLSSRPPCEELSIARGGLAPPQQLLRFKLQFGSQRCDESSVLLVPAFARARARARRRRGEPQILVSQSSRSPDLLQRFRGSRSAGARQGPEAPTET
jgi:hypothetical protein